MGQEKEGSKGAGGYVGGFFQLFEWNRKTRKKLSYNKLELSEGAKQGKRSAVDLQTTQLLSIEDDENVGVSSMKGSSDYSCASSVIEDEGNGVRAPGVVAKLMGLDSLPTHSVTEPYSSPFFQLQALKDTQYNRKVSEYENEYHQHAYFSNQASRVEAFYRKTIESRPQKLSSPIERYCTETLPPKTVKSHIVTQHKLFSPIKSPGFIPPKNAADIIEAAVRTIEPGYQSAAKNRYPSVGPSSNARKFRDLKENTAATQRPSKLSEVSRKPVESNAVKYLKGQSMNKSWNGSEDTPNLRAHPDSEDSHSIGSRNKGKSISLAIQAKVNVQRREGLNSGSTTFPVWKEDEEHKLSQPFKIQQNIPKNRQNKPATSPAPSVLRQNNQKQNCAATKEKLLLKPSVSNQHSRRFIPGETSNGRNKTFKSPGNSKIGYKNGGLEEAGLEKEISSSRMKNLPRKKRAIEANFHSERSGFVEAGLLDGGEKIVQPCAMINGQLNLPEDSRRKGMDVVSFTFTSPIVKSLPGSRSNNQMVEKGNATNACYTESDGGKNATGGMPKRLSSVGLNVIGGDALSILLEQKLRELTSEFESSSSSSADTGKDCTTSGSILEDLVSALNSMSVMPMGFDKTSAPALQKEKFSGGSKSSCSSANGQVLRVSHNLQGPEGTMDCSSSSDARKELDCHHPSPVSILEASFSNESCNSSESGDVNNGGKLNSLLSIQAQNLIGNNCLKVASSLEVVEELLDSATSRFMVVGDSEPHPSISMTDHMGTEQWEMDYVKEILFSARLTFQDLALGHAHDIIDPRLFDRLEGRKLVLKNWGEDGSGKTSRKELFDCVSEYMDLKCSRYVCGGYKAWAKGAAILRKEGIVEEIFKEISGWRRMGEWMVDELVDKDMSSPLGRWLDFEAEAFETGVEIERWILSSLLDEAITDLL